MAQVNAGRVRFIGRGEYDNSTQYYTFDFVNYNGNSYFAKSDTLGNLPTDTTHWQLVAEKGNVGSIGPTGNGIASITKTSTTGLVDTYTITFTDGNTTTFNVTNGNSIDHISLTSQSGATKVYTIYFTDGNTTTFTVQDGEVTQEVFDEEIERANMIYNAMPKVSGEGTDLTLDNTAECPVYEVGLSPSELEQETTTGKNLANINVIDNISTSNVKLTIVNDTITISDNVNAAGYISCGKKLSILCPSLQVGDVVYLFFDTTSSVTNKNIIFIGETWTKGTSKTITQTMLDSNVALYGGYNETAVISNFMITKENDNTYEPYTYGASPNPQYPQEIHTVSGENTVVVGNKNLADFSTFVNGFPNAGGTFSQAHPNNEKRSLFIKVKPNTTYTFSILNAVLTYSNWMAIAEYKSNVGSSIITRNVNTSTDKYMTITTNTNTNYVVISARNLIDSVEVQLEQNTIATTYKEPKSQSLPISLGDLEYCKIGDYEDEFVKRKNLFNKEVTTFDGYVANDGTETLSVNYKTSDYIPIEPNTTYATGVMTNSGSNPSRCYYDENKTFISGEKHFGATTMVGTSPNNAKYMRESIPIVDIDNVMINEGTSALPYIPYDNGKWYLKKNIGKVVLNGSEDWNSGGVSTNEELYRFRCTTLDTYMILGVKSYSNKFNYIGNISSLNVTEEGICNTSSSPRFYLWISKDRVNGTSSSDIKAWLVTNNVTVYYILATPTNILLSDTLQTQLDNIHKAITYQDQTNVSQTNADLPFVIKLSAIRDLSGIFELIQ